MSRYKSKLSLRNLFRSNSVSTTNPRDDLSDLLGIPRSSVPYNANNYGDTYDFINISNIVQAIRNTESVRDELYREYREMDQEVIVHGALKLYADDATVIDNTRGRSVWIDSDNEKLVTELTEFLDSIEVGKNIWGWIYQIAQYGDKYLENIFNRKGYLIGVKDVKLPEYVYDVVEDGQHEGYVVRRDPRLKKYSQSSIYGDIDMYAPGRFTHMYLADNPNEETLILDYFDPSNNDQIDYVELEVVRGNSAIESVRTINRILRLLEDTVITNKIARAEYIRIFNIEVGETSGIGSDSIVRRFKRMFDSRPRFDGTKGEYTSTRNYRPAADAIFNSVHNGQGAVDVKDIGGDIETRWMTDLEYFRDKMFTGLQIPKEYLGFDSSLGFNGGGTLARLDVRYCRTVRRIQNAAKEGLTDLCDLWLASRHRENDIGKYRVMMQNPSSAEEMSRIEELVSRLDAINKVAETLNNVAPDQVNLPKLYKELVDEFIDIPSIRSIFEDILSKSIIIRHIEINSQLAKARSDSIESYKNLGNSIDSLTDPRSGDELSSDTEDGDMSDEFSSDFNSDFGSDDFGSNDFPLDDNSPDNEIELGSLGDELGVSNEEPEDDSSGTSSNELLDSYRLVSNTKVLENYYSTNKTKSELLDDLITLSVNGPKDLRTNFDKLSEKLSIEGFTKENIDKAYELLNMVDNRLNKSGITTKKVLAVTDNLLDTSKRISTAKFLDGLLNDKEGG